jgi:hypothetical protein
VNANHLKEYRALIKEKELIRNCDRNAVAEFEPYLVTINYGSSYIDLKLELLSITHDGLDTKDPDEGVLVYREFETRAKRFFPDLTLEQVTQLMFDWQWEQKQQGWKDSEEGLDYWLNR